MEAGGAQCLYRIPPPQLLPLHEFGFSFLPLADCWQWRDSSFAFWPGFSLNPGITDLHRLEALLRDSSRPTRLIARARARASPAGVKGSSRGSARNSGSDHDRERVGAKKRSKCDSATFDLDVPDEQELEASAFGDSLGWFDDEDSMFEHTFSLRAHASGANMAFLPVIAFQHSAAKFESAYRLQGIERYWDNGTITIT